jgi:glycerol-3-phosphate O-acyltransferase
VIVRFGEPIKVSEHVAAVKASKNSTPSSKELVSSLADQIVSHIRGQTSLTLTSISYTALMNTSHYGLTSTGLSRAIHSLVKLAQLHIRVDNLPCQLSPSLRRFLELESVNPTHFLGRGAISHTSLLGEDMYYIKGDKRFTAHFYKNSVVHLFVPFGLLSIDHLLHGSMQASRCKMLYDLFAYDLQLRPWEQYTEFLDALLKEMHEDGIAQQSSAGYTIQRPDHLLPGLLHDAIQSHLWVYTHLKRHQQNVSDSISYKELLQALQGNSKAGKYLDLLNSTEAASQSTLTSTLGALEKRGVIEIADNEQRIRQVHIVDLPDEEITLLSTIDREIRRWQISHVSDPLFDVSTAPTGKK